MLLAAGLGERLRPLTNTTPKPLIEVAGKPLLQYHIENLRDIGVTELVINTSWLAEKIEDYFADGERFGVSIQWSREVAPLETGGGIYKALRWLGEQPFMLVNGDVWSDFPLGRLQQVTLGESRDAHLVMVENPAHNASGDFALQSGLLARTQVNRLTFSGISLIHPRLFANAPAAEKFPLREVLFPAMDQGRISGELYSGGWCDVGTVERLDALEASLQRG